MQETSFDFLGKMLIS